MPSEKARTFKIGEPVRIMTDRPLEAILEGNPRLKRPALVLMASSYQGARGFVTGASPRMVGGPPIAYEVRTHAPETLPAPRLEVPWFPEVARAGRFILWNLRAGDLERDPEPTEPYEQFVERQIAEGSYDVNVEHLLLDADELLDARLAVRNPEAWRAAYRELFPEVRAEWWEQRLKAAQDHWAQERIDELGGIAEYLARKMEWEGEVSTAETEEAFAAIRAAEAGDRSLLDVLLDIHSRFRPYPIELLGTGGTEVPTTACFDCDAIVPVTETVVNKKGLAVCEGCFTKREAKGRARRGRTEN